AKYLTLRFPVKLDKMSYQTYELLEDLPRQQSGSLVTENSLENAYLKATINSNGSLTILDKETHQSVTGLIFEDTEISATNMFISRIRRVKPISQPNFQAL
ncbi:MAG: hypothetical protein WAU93_05525, partial [Lactococcus raffinolactis]